MHVKVFDVVATSTGLIDSDDSETTIQIRLIFVASNRSNPPLVKSVSTCIHGAKFPRSSVHSPVVNRCDGHGLHLALISGPRRGIVTTGGCRKTRIVCVFEYCKDQWRGFVAVLICPPNNTSLIPRRIEEAADQLVRIIQERRRPQTVYRLEESQGLIAEIT